MGVGGRLPVVFNTRNVPLVNDGNNLLSGGISVESIEQINILLIDDDLLLVGGKLFEVFNKPVGSESIHRFSISFTTNNVKCGIVIKVFSSPERVVESSVTIVSLGNGVHSGFTLQRIKGNIIDFQTTENDGDLLFIGFFNSEFHFQTRNEGVEVIREGLEPVGNKKPRVELSLENHASNGVIQFPSVSSLQQFVVSIEFLLAVNTFNILSDVPPFLVSLNE